MTRTGFASGSGDAAIVSCTSLAPSSGRRRTVLPVSRIIVDTRLAGETIDTAGFVLEVPRAGVHGRVPRRPSAGARIGCSYGLRHWTNGSPRYALFVPFVIDGNTASRSTKAYRQKADAGCGGRQEQTVPVPWSVVLERAGH